MCRNFARCVSGLPFSIAPCSNSTTPIFRVNSVPTFNKVVNALRDQIQQLTVRDRQNCHVARNRIKGLLDEVDYWNKQSLENLDELVTTWRLLNEAEANITRLQVRAHNITALH